MLWLLQRLNNLHLCMLKLFKISLRPVSNVICCILNNNNKFWRVIGSVSDVSGWRRVLSMPRVHSPANCFPGHRDRLIQCCLIWDVTQTQTHYPVWHQLFSYMQIETFLALVVCHSQPASAVITVIRAVEDCDKYHIMEGLMCLKWLRRDPRCILYHS